MSECLIKRNPWDNLTEEEQDHLIWYIRRYRIYLKVKDNMRLNYELIAKRYPRFYKMIEKDVQGKQHAFINDSVLINMERLSRKAWGVQI